MSSTGRRSGHTNVEMQIGGRVETRPPARVTRDRAEPAGVDPARLFLMAISRLDLDSLLRRITVRSDIFGGKPIIRDLRISVELIVSLLAQGITVEDILDDYPALEPDDIRACLAYAHAVIAHDSLDAVAVEAG